MEAGFNIYVWNGSNFDTLYNSVYWTNADGIQSSGWGWPLNYAVPSGYYLVKAYGKNASGVKVEASNQWGWFQITAESYTVSYSANGGSGGMATSTHTYGVAKTLSPNLYSRTGYTFKGWSTTSGAAVDAAINYSDAANVSNLTTTSLGLVTLYAVWKPITYNVLYNANGGSGSTSSSSHTYGVAKALTANAFSRTGYNFKGWSTAAGAAIDAQTNYANNASVTNLSATNGASVNLYAVWAPITYRVSFNANGGSNAPADQTKEYDVNIQISEQAPTRAGYNFMGWAVSAAAAAQGTVAYAPGDWYDGNADLSLYAVWMANRWLGETEMFSFANTASAFGNSYAVSDADFRKLTDYVYSGFANDTATAENKVNAMQALRGSDWLGSCYGMAAAAILDKQGGIDFEQNFDRDAQTLYEVDRPVDNEQVRSAINYYMLAQKSGLIQLKGAKNGDPTWNRILQELVNATRRGDLIFFCYTFAGMDLSDWTDTDLGHAIVIRGYEWDAANGSHNLIAYDNRYPDQECIVRIDGGCTYGYLQYTDSNGAVNRPAAHSTAKTVTLTATISKGGQSTTKTFTVTVQPQECNNIHIWGKHTHYASNFWNWFLCIVCFGWIWMLWW